MIPRFIGRVSALALLIVALAPGYAHAQLRDGSTQTLTAADGSVFELTTGFVQVPGAMRLSLPAIVFQD